MYLVWYTFTFPHFGLLLFIPTLLSMVMVVLLLHFYLLVVVATYTPTTKMPNTPYALLLSRIAYGFLPYLAMRTSHCSHNPNPQLIVVTLQYFLSTESISHLFPQFALCPSRRLMHNTSPTGLPVIPHHFASTTLHIPRLEYVTLPSRLLTTPTLSLGYYY